MRRAPFSMAASASAQIASMRSARESPPPETRYRPERVAALKPGMSPSALMWMSLASSSLSITGKGSVTLRQAAAVGSSRLPCGPSEECREVTSSSRMASSGGLVTCANSCVK